MRVVRVRKYFTRVHRHLKGTAGAQTKKNRYFQDLIEVGSEENRPFLDLAAHVSHPKFGSTALI